MRGLILACCPLTTPCLLPVSMATLGPRPAFRGPFLQAAFLVVPVQARSRLRPHILATALMLSLIRIWGAGERATPRPGNSLRTWPLSAAPVGSVLLAFGPWPRQGPELTVLIRDKRPPDP